VDADAEVSDCARTEESEESRMLVLVVLLSVPLPLGSVPLVVDAKAVGRPDERVFDWERYGGSSIVGALPLA
jgi:hypothetical protein